MSKSLTQQQIQSLQETLQARHRVLSELIHIELMNSSNQVHVELAGLVHDTKDESVANALREVNLKVVRMHIDELDDIAASEQRILTSEFGRCSDCDENIGFARLTVYPTAKRCIDCQRVHESGRSA